MNLLMPYASFDLFDKYSTGKKDEIFYYKTQKDAIQKSNETGLIMYSSELPSWVDKKSGREFTGLRKFAVTTPSRIAHEIINKNSSSSHWYEMIPLKPCHLFMDFDKDLGAVGSDMTTMQESIDEMFRLILKTCTENSDKKLPGWDFDPLQIKYCRLDANKPGKKDSSHFVLRLPGNRMFRDVLQLKSFIARCLEIGLSEKNYENNKLYVDLQDKGYCSVCDITVYTPYRNWRMAGCCKAKPGAVPLFPENIKESRQLTPGVIFANSPTMIEYDPANDCWVTPVLLDSPKCEFVKKNKRKRTHVDDSMKIEPICVSASATYSLSASLSRPVSYLMASPVLSQNTIINTDKSIPPARMADLIMFEKLAAAITKQLATPYPFTIATADANHATLKCKNYHTCPNLHHSSSGDHKSNHVSVVISVAFPRPEIKFFCLDEECKKIAQTKDIDWTLQPDPRIFEDVFLKYDNYFKTLHVSLNDLLL